MDIAGILLKTKYFSSDKDTQLKAKTVTLFIGVLGVLLVFEYFAQKTIYASYVVATMAAIAVGVYGLFPATISVRTAARIVVFLSIVCIGMGVNGVCSGYFVTFLMAMLPAVVFYLFDRKEAIVWSVLPIVALVTFAIIDFVSKENIGMGGHQLVQIVLVYVLIVYLFFQLEQKRQNDARRLKFSLRTNRVIFKEMHHRTKNNLQLIMGLLEIQAFRTQDPKIKKTFQAYIDRIKAMSFVHENLYKNEQAAHDIESVDMRKYLTEVLNNLQQLTQHTIITDIDYVTLDIKQSMNIGLIVNEAVSNAIEHAYGSRTGRIDVSLKLMGDYHILEIKDYGKGFRSDFEYESLGLNLIRDLGQALPQGSVQIETEEGTVVRVMFGVASSKK